MNNRLRQKCFVASAGIHLLLGLILIVGPAFLASRNASDNMPILNFVAYETVDAAVSGGGSPTAKPPPPAPPTPTPPQPLPPAPPQVEKTQAPEPVKEIVKEYEKAQPKPTTEPAEPSPEPAPRKPKISTELVTRTPSALARERAKASAAQAKTEAQARQRLAREFGRAAGSISSDLSGSTEVELPGPGGGGVPYANFLQAVKSVYTQAWMLPDGVTDDDATVTASVTIARDGTVVNARIIRASSSLEVNRSVQRTLDSVKWAAPLPRDAKEDERTVNINFNVKAKKALG